MSVNTGFQSKRTIALGMVIGTGGLTYFGIVPIVLGGLLSSGRIDAAQLGWAATAETIFTAAGLLLGIKLLGPSSSRWIVVLAGLIMAAANLLTLVAPDIWQILAVRSVAGMSQGVLVAVAALSIAFSSIPARLSGIFLAVSVPPPLFLAYYLPSALMPRFGSSAGFATLAFIGAICALCALFIRDDFALKLRESRNRIRWTLPTVSALVGILLSSAGFGAAWAYVDPLGASHNLLPSQIGLAVSAAIVGQFVVSTLVAVIGWRLPMLMTLLVVSGVQIAIPILMLASGTPLSFVLVLTAFGLLWQGASPFATGLLAALDDSRMLAPLTFPLQLVGLAVGPLAASAVAGTDIALVLIIASGFYAITFLAYLLVMYKTARSGIVLPKTVEEEVVAQPGPILAQASSPQ